VISVENRKFFPPSCILRPAEGVLLEFDIGARSLQKLEWWGYRTEQEVWRYL